LADVSITENVPHAAIIKTIPVRACDWINVAGAWVISIPL